MKFWGVGEGEGYGKSERELEATGPSTGTLEGRLKGWGCIDPEWEAIYRRGNFASQFCLRESLQSENEVGIE